MCNSLILDTRPDVTYYAAIMFTVRRLETEVEISNFPLRVPEDLKAEAERYLAARGACAVPGNAREILGRSGHGNVPREDDRIG